uniref:SET domain-containing protein n=1 Tax=Mesocestoides corti TaxID=53468 RepID=A0A5K3F1B0_MESCO
FLTIIDGAYEVTDPQTELPSTSLINHACDPNMTVIPVRVDDVEPLLALFAKRDIRQSEELTYNYSHMSFTAFERTGKTCLCNSSFCLGYLPFCV